MTDDVLQTLESYYDAVPRSSARAEDFGPLTLFVRDSSDGWPFYGRPTGSVTEPITAADVDRVRARQRELDIPQAFEWVDEVTPSLRAAVEKSGLTVHEHPLMVLEANVSVPDVAVPPGVQVRIIGVDDPALPSALTVPHLAFADRGTQIGAAGPAELAAAVADRAGDASIANFTARIRSGLTVVAAAVDESGLALCAGSHQPVGPVSEVVGVGTLPSARRQGLALAVTAALVRDARAGGVRTVFMSADDGNVARIYGRLGFGRVGTALIAEPA